MPIFEYKCHFCGAEIDKLERNLRGCYPKPAIDCPNPRCSGVAVIRRIPSTFKFQLGHWKEVNRG